MFIPNSYLRSILFFILFFLASCTHRGGGSNASILIEQVKVQESSPTVTVPGILIPRDKVDVKIQYGAKIMEVLVNKGDRVVEGAVLAKLSDEEINLKLSQLRAAKKEAETLLEKNAYLLKNRDKLLEEGKIDKVQYDGVDIENSSAENTLNRIKTDIAVAEYNSAHLQITSPISGTIVEKYASPMQIAGENQVLFSIINVDPITVSFPLTADESAGIKTGMQISTKIEELGGAEYTATVTYISPEINQTGKTFDVWASIPNPDYTLKSGMLATTQFISTNIHKVIVVPDSSIITRGRDKFVFTVSGGVAHETKIHIRNINNNIAEISSGLAENDLIIAKGAQNIQDGAVVEVRR